MSYQMTHLEVAYQLLDEYKWIDVQSDFLLGAIAPGANVIQLLIFNIY